MQQTLAATPGYQFTLAQGLQGVNNSAAARGMLKSGNTLQALTQYASGLADNTYQQAVQNTQNAVGLGQAAAAGQAAQIGQAGTNLGNIAIGQGENMANIDMNTVAGLSSLAGNAMNYGIMQKTIDALNNPTAYNGYVGPTSGGIIDPQGGFSAWDK
jgi:hypothetical protein